MDVAGAEKSKKKKPKRIVDDNETSYQDELANMDSIDIRKLSYEDAYIYKMSTPISLTNLMVNMPICLLAISLMALILVAFAVQSFGWLLP